VRAAKRAETIRRLAITSIAAQATWLVLIVVAGLIEPGYSEIRDAVSVLGARDATRPWLFDAGVAIWGCAFLCAAAALALDSRRSWRNWLGPGLIALTGLAQILDGFPFPADCRWSIDATCRTRETAGELSWQHYAHGITYFFGAIALLASVFAMAWRFRDDERWGRSDQLALGSGLLGIAIFGVLFFLIGNEVNGQYGLVQRLALAVGGLWVLALAVALLAIHGRPGEPAFRLVEWVRGLPGGRLVPVPGSGSLEGLAKQRVRH
jgi:Protein of unknown function (DUF998)